MADISISSYRRTIREHARKHGVLEAPAHVTEEARELFGPHAVVVPAEAFIVLNVDSARAPRWHVKSPCLCAVEEQKTLPTMIRGTGRSPEAALEDARRMKRERARP